MTGLDRELVLWNTDTGTSVQSFSGHSRGVIAVCFLNDHKWLVSAGVDQSVRVWDVESGKLIRGLSQHTMTIHDVRTRPGDHE